MLLRLEGIAREFVNKIQNIRKESNFDVTDRINITIEKADEFNEALIAFKDYICAQTLANSIEITEKLNDAEIKQVEIDKDLFANLVVKKA
jgi:isoleucyl-tRNA synthetase